MTTSQGHTSQSDDLPAVASLRPTFGVSVDDKRVILSGEVDLAAHDAIRNAVNSVGDNATIDLAGVTFIDSSGLRCILRSTQDVEAAQVINAAPHVRRLFEVTGLDTVIPFADPS